jgi:anaerobic ribonucleoside-triphosphate reductase activating protein
MLRFQSYDIVFQEVPNEVTLAINLANCPNGCKGCHSPHLQQDMGEWLTESALDSLLAEYGGAVTCICFMGGDADPCEVDRLARYVRAMSSSKLKTAWYSGKSRFPDSCALSSFDYLKLGPYIEQLGGLQSPTTNQRFYRIDNEQMTDCTGLFTKQQSATQ